MQAETIGRIADRKLREGLSQRVAARRNPLILAKNLSTTFLLAQAAAPASAIRARMAFAS